MNELEIDHYLSHDVYTKKYFRGVMAYDELPYTQKAKSGLYIVNTDISTGPGIHWVSILVGDICEYFDPLGNPPDKCKPFIENQEKVYIYSDKKIQAPESDVCGDYCVLFSYYRCREMSMKSFIAMFTEDKTLNDVMIEL